MALDAHVKSLLKIFIHRFSNRAERWRTVLLITCVVVSPIGQAHIVTPSNIFFNTRQQAYDSCNLSAALRQTQGNASYNCYLVKNAWLLEERTSGLAGHAHQLVMNYFPTIACTAGKSFQGPAPGSCQTGAGSGSGSDGPTPDAGPRDLGQPDSCTSRGNPCNVANGNKYQLETDYENPNSRLTFQRSYNSLDRRDNGLGHGWTTSANVRLEVMANSNTVVYWYRDGRGEPFNCGSTSSYGGLFGPTQLTCRGYADTPLALTKLLTSTSPYIYELLHPNWSRQQFDAAGRLLVEIDPTGLTTRYSYGTDGQLARVVGPFGHSLSFSYDTAGRLTGMGDPAGQITSYDYDTSANLASVTRPDGSRKQYHYENSNFPHALTGITDENGNRFATYAYDASGRVSLTEHAGGYGRFGFQYDSPTQTTVTDAAGTVEVFTFQEILSRKRLVRRTWPVDGKALTFSYDTNANLIRKTDEEGRITTYTYSKNKLTGLTEATGTPQARTTRISYHNISNTPLSSVSTYLPTLFVYPSVWSPSGTIGVSLPSGGSTSTVGGASGVVPSTLPPHHILISWTHDTAANEFNRLFPYQIVHNGLTPTGQAVRRTTTLTYSATLKLLSGINMDGIAVSMDFNECMTGGQCGQANRFTDALGLVTYFDTYDTQGHLVQSRDPRAVVTNYTYDVRGRVTSISEVHSMLTRVTRFSYDPAGQLTSVVHPDGGSLSLAHDAAHLLRMATDNLGNRREYDYDARGNLAGERLYDPNGTLVRHIEAGYDPRNVLNAVRTGGATGSLTQLVNDTLGNLLYVTDPNRNPPTTHSYDALNRLVQTVDALSSTTLYSYDVNDNLRRIVAPNGATTEYNFDDLGNLLQEISPDRGTRSYTRDPRGNPTSITEARGVTAALAYDSAGRLKKIDYPGTAEDVAYNVGPCINASGKFCGMRDESGLTEYQYDNMGRIEYQIPPLGANYRTRYTYDSTDRPLTLTWRDTGGIERFAVTYDRDPVGRVARIAATVNGVSQVIANNLTYRADGLLTGLTYGNGLSETRLYDLQDRLVNQFIGTADTRVYGYDANGNLLGTQTLPDVFTYSYDRLNRLASERSGAINQAFNFDANGNRLSDSARRYGYSNASNRLVAAGTQNLTLDAAGNVTADGLGRSFIYNQAGRLAQIYDGNILTASYLYNGFGQRVRKTTAIGTTLYYYDIHGRLFLETDAAGLTQRIYVWLNDQPIAQIDKTPQGDVVTYLHSDHLQTPRLATDANQRVIWRWEGNAFGDMLPNEDPDGDGVKTTINLRFPGQYYDLETGLHYNWNRYYDPKIGRYVTSDPIGLEGGLNTYSYVMSNPLYWIDPLGLEPPAHHPGLDVIKQNVQTAQGIWDPRDFRSFVQNQGAWDYKQQNPDWQNFGNYNYGLTGAASGLFTLDTLLREAGRAQCTAGTSDPKWGKPEYGSPYGDDPIDQMWVIEGWNDYFAGMYGKPSSGKPLLPLMTDYYSRNRGPTFCSGSGACW